MIKRLKVEGSEVKWSEVKWKVKWSELNWIEAKWSEDLRWIVCIIMIYSYVVCMCVTLPNAFFCHIFLLLFALCLLFFVMFWLTVLCFFNYSFYICCFVFSAFYLACSVFLYCFVYCLSPYIELFILYFVQFYRPLPPSGKPYADNKYHKKGKAIPLQA